MWLQRHARDSRLIGAVFERAENAAHEIAAKVIDKIPRLKKEAPKE